MMSPLHLLRVASLLASASWNLVSEDPRGFAGKLAERIRQSDSPVLSAVPSTLLRRLATAPVSEARKLIDAGHLTAGVQHVANQGRAASRGDIRLAKRALERLEQLKTPPPSTTWKNTPRSTGHHRVLHVLTNSKPFTASGYTVRSHHVLTSQREVGIDAWAVTRLGYPVLVGKIPTSFRQSIDGVTYHRFLPWLHPPTLNGRVELTVRLLVETARAMDATILHTTTDYTNALIVAEAAKRLGIPWVYEVRGELESTWLSRQSADRQAEAGSSEFYQLARSQETRYMRVASAVVALSDVSRSQMVDRGVEPGRIHVVPNAVESDYIGKDFDRTEIRRELGLDPGVVLVGTVMSVVDYEGLDVLIRALEHLPENTTALIVGDGTARPSLEKLVHELGLANRVIFAGRQSSEDIWRWYAALDVFAVPRKDTKVTRTVTPIKPLIAMALNIPVVASELPALREVTGGLANYVAPENPVALSQGIRASIGKGQHGPTWASSRTWSENGTRYLKLYDTLVTI